MNPVEAVILVVVTLVLGNSVHRLFRDGRSVARGINVDGPAEIAKAPAVPEPAAKGDPAAVVSHDCQATQNAHTEASRFALEGRYCGSAKDRDFQGLRVIARNETTGAETETRADPALGGYRFDSLPLVEGPNRFTLRFSWEPGRGPASAETYEVLVVRR